MSDLLEIKNLILYVTGQDPIEINDFHIISGENVFIIGKNGSGKSTILKYLFSPIKEDYYATHNSNASAVLTSKKTYKDKIISIDLLNRQKFENCTSYLSFVYIEQEESFVSLDSVIVSILNPTIVALNETRNFPFSSIDFQEKVKHYEIKARHYAIKYLKDVYQYHKKYKEAKKNHANQIELDDLAFKILSKKKTRECSGGQKKMISLLSGFLRAEALQVDLVVFDEPLNHLDRQNKIAINELINEVRTKSESLSFLIVSHLMFFDLINLENSFQYKVEQKIREKISYEKKEFFKLFKKSID